MATAKASKKSPIEILTESQVSNKDRPPIITVRTGQTDGQTYYVKINHLGSRAVMIAVHL